MSLIGIYVILIAEQVLVEPGLEGDFFVLLPQGCGEASGEVVQLVSPSPIQPSAAPSSCRLHQDSSFSRVVRCYCTITCALRFTKEGSVPMMVVVHVNYSFTVGLKSSSTSRRGFVLVPINDVGELRWFARCQYSRDKANDLLAISHMHVC